MGYNGSSCWPPIQFELAGKEGAKLPSSGSQLLLASRSE